MGMRRHKGLPAVSTNNGSFTKRSNTTCSARSTKSSYIPLIRCSSLQVVRLKNKALIIGEGKLVRIGCPFEFSNDDQSHKKGVIEAMNSYTNVKTISLPR